MHTSWQFIMFQYHMLPLYVPHVGDCVFVSTPPKFFTKITEATASRRRSW